LREVWYKIKQETILNPTTNHSNRKERIQFAHLYTFCSDKILEGSKEEAFIVLHKTIEFINKYFR
jgi:HD superfamily phosphohydrolase YqeK